MAGFRLRGYSVERLLGRGASSEVWRARVATSGEPVALKRLLRTDAHQLSRAHAEAALLSVLDHPNLVRLHAVVPTPDAAVLVLDLADGGSLADLLAVRGRLTPGEVVTAVAPVAAALAYVHRQGVVHGDVSAANLLFTPGGTALLADLGVARLTGDDTDAESTPAYVDPAVAAGCVPVAVSDVFMLGAVTLHALTGAPLWAGRTADEMLAAAHESDVSGVAGRLAAAQVPEAMAAVVLRALVVDPRYRCTAADFALDLRHSETPVAVELAAGRRSAELPPPDAEPPRRRVIYDPRHAAPAGGPSGFAPRTTRVPPAGIGTALPRAWSPAEPDRTPPAELPRRVPSGGLFTGSSGGSSAESSGGLSAVPSAVPPAGSPAEPDRAPPADLPRRVPSGGSSAESSAGSFGGSIPGTPGRVPQADRNGSAQPDPPPWRAPVDESSSPAADADRPSPAAPLALPPTSAVQRPRPVIPRAPRRRVNRRLVGLATLGVLAATAAVALVTTRDASETAAPAPRRSNIAATVDWETELQRLDQVRARAFAVRDASLLSAVYPVGRLRSADADLVRRLVPVGCRLPGVSTRFSQVRVAPEARRAVITARSSIPATRLRCAGGRRTPVAAVSPAPVRIVLVSTPAGVRIADLSN